MSVLMVSTKRGQKSNIDLSKSNFSILRFSSEYMVGNKNTQDKDTYLRNKETQQTLRVIVSIQYDASF